MNFSPERTARTDAATTKPPADDRHEVALEPGQAWCLKGLMGDPDEIVIPGLLLDDLGGCTSVEAVLDVATFYQMLAMASLEEARMLASRSADRPDRSRAEANVWAVTGLLAGTRLALREIRALDRVVVDGYGTRRVETLRARELVPGPRAWR